MRIESWLLLLTSSFRLWWLNLISNLLLKMFPVSKHSVKYSRKAIKWDEISCFITLFITYTHRKIYIYTQTSWPYYVVKLTYVSFPKSRSCPGGHWCSYLMFVSSLLFSLLKRRWILSPGSIPQGPHKMVKMVMVAVTHLPVVTNTHSTVCATFDKTSFAFLGKIWEQIA